MMGKKLSEVSNGTAKPRDQQQTMSFAKKDMGAAAHKNEGKPQNGRWSWSWAARSILTVYAQDPSALILPSLETRMEGAAR